MDKYKKITGRTKSDMPLGEFVDKFVEPNSILFINRIEFYEEGHYKVIPLWKGMSWRCTKDKVNLDYMERRRTEFPVNNWEKDFSPCKFSDEQNFYIKSVGHNLIDQCAIDIILD